MRVLILVSTYVATVWTLLTEALLQIFASLCSGLPITKTKFLLTLESLYYYSLSGHLEGNSREYMTALLGKGRRGWFHDLKAATGNWDPTADRSILK